MNKAYLEHVLLLARIALSDKPELATAYALKAIEAVNDSKTTKTQLIAVIALARAALDSNASFMTAYALDAIRITTRYADELK